MLSPNHVICSISFSPFQFSQTQSVLVLIGNSTKIFLTALQNEYLSSLHAITPPPKKKKTQKTNKQTNKKIKQKKTADFRPHDLSGTYPFCNSLMHEKCFCNLKCVILKNIQYPARSIEIHDDVIKWKHFPHHWPFVREIHWSPVNSQRPVTQNFDVFFDQRLNKRLRKQSRRRWLETPSRSSLRHC